MVIEEKLLGASPSDLGEGVHGCVVCLGEAVQVLLGGEDAAVAEPFFNHLDVGPAGEQPGGVRVSKVVEAQRGLEPSATTSGLPDMGAEP